MVCSIELRKAQCRDKSGDSNSFGNISLTAMITVLALIPFFRCGTRTWSKHVGNSIRFATSERRWLNIWSWYWANHYRSVCFLPTLAYHVITILRYKIQVVLCDDRITKTYMRVSTRCTTFTNQSNPIQMCELQLSTVHYSLWGHIEAYSWSCLFLHVFFRKLHLIHHILFFHKFVTSLDEILYVLLPHSTAQKCQTKNEMSKQSTRQTIKNCILASAKYPPL